VAKEMQNFAYEVFLSYSYVSLTCRTILRNGTNGLISPQKEVVLLFSSPLKIPSSSTGFEPAKHDCNDNYTNH
jgi:hypothetical protein